MCKQFFLLGFFILIQFTLSCQITIDSIIVFGLKHTKSITVQRESSIYQGQEIAYSEKDKVLEKSKDQLLSTGLFNSVEVKLDSTNGNYNLIYEIKENWYLYPVPLFELADRNFNVWWQEQGRDFSRTVYGVDISHYNLTGRRDPLSVKFQAGYTRKAELKYQLPQILGEKWGIAGGFFYSDNKEIGYKTIGNKTQFSKHPNEIVLLKRRRMGFRLLNRGNVYTHHSFRLEYHHNSVDPYVIENLNDQYFLENRTDLRFMFFEYDFQYDKRVYTLYPKSGYILRANFKQEGFRIFKDYRNSAISFRVEHYLPAAKGLVLGNIIDMKTNLTRQIVSFANNTGIGWGRYKIMGYDLYVQDGTDFFISKNYLSLNALNKVFKLFRFLPEQFRTLPISIYTRFNFDFGYSNERTYTETNTLNNRIIFGYGPVLDVIFYNNFLFSIEYGFNDLGEQGLFLSNKISF